QIQQDSYTILKSDTQHMVSPQQITNKIEVLGSPVKDKQETIQSVTHLDGQHKLDSCETQSNATVEDNNSKLVIQKSYSQAVMG
ncbi:37553_t:CDS:2, partial [Gigaspora margarita]